MPESMDEMGRQENELKPAPWGFWATLGISAFIILSYFVCGIIATAGFVGLYPSQDLGTDPSRLASNGTLVTLAVLISSPITLLLTYLFARLRREVPIKDYLGLHELGLKKILLWSFILVVFAAGSDLLTFLLKRPILQEFLLNVYATATSKPLLWFALVIAAPVSEEIFFRGFVFYGILHTKLGSRGAIALSSLIWAPLHFQYDLYGILTVVILGLLFGYARLKTNSVYATIVMHALMNFIAATEILIHIGLTSGKA